MDIGKNIRKYRTERNMTQEMLAEKLGVTFQAVSSWERDEYLPETENLIKLAQTLKTPLSAIVEEDRPVFRTKDNIFDWEHMKTYVKTTAKSFRLIDTLKAVDYAVTAHAGQTRKNTNIPYIYHPLSTACHALAMGIREDEIIAACLLHDVIEDCNKNESDLPVGNETREIVRQLSHGKTTNENRVEIMDAYYGDIAVNPKAALVKCIDRCNNLTTMSWGLCMERIIRMISETEKYYPALLDVIKSVPEYNDAAWLLKYQIESMLDIYKRLL